VGRIRVRGLSPACFGLSASKSYRLMTWSRSTSSLNIDDDLVDCRHPTMLWMWYDVVLPLSNTAFARLVDGITYK
jgi:hypothetical protein